MIFINYLTWRVKYKICEYLASHIEFDLKNYEVKPIENKFKTTI